ncbi:hypothetical protein [Kitasatospora cathayae]|uniref:Uncharacterized protein n=1 Tax=Kitasatospora cathayae TaxID=3004092 RepID=A0ABY7Q300_9ACTN|nr:hypothetical protein [Kitasatospora sp. HUAS 3-15]WBP87023.1 hypothetical protein O1G21_15015 [Kitasatospora sp. HUAS 3-15]
MAKAVSIEKQGTLTETTVALTLSLQEAEFLAAVLARIGGDPLNSPRKHQKSISYALHDDAGVRWGIGASRHASALSEGRIMFDNYPDDWTESERG